MDAKTAAREAAVCIVVDLIRITGPGLQEPKATGSAHARDRTG